MVPKTYRRKVPEVSQEPEAPTPVDFAGRLAEGPATPSATYQIW